MADLPPYRDVGEEGDDRQPARSTPRWLALLGIMIVIALIVLLVVLHVTGTLGSGAH